MKKFVCQICGYVYEGEVAPEYCPQCKAPASKFTEMCGDRTWAAEHIVGIAKDVAEDIKWICALILPANAPKLACTWQ